MAWTCCLLPPALLPPPPVLHLLPSFRPSSHVPQLPFQSCLSPATPSASAAFRHPLHRSAYENELSHFPASEARDYFWERWFWQFCSVIQRQSTEQGEKIQCMNTHTGLLIVHLEGTGGLWGDTKLLWTVGVKELIRLLTSEHCSFLSQGQLLPTQLQDMPLRWQSSLLVEDRHSKPPLHALTKSFTPHASRCPTPPGSLFSRAHSPCQTQNWSEDLA